eukprot:gnl/Dysnectes_brevis/1167_a1301_2084.p1 GENE.gnl/Dysnectes_brevis/1167_a1301_2084~~gnl/Dysnectes_brevis/1167_a1301_2084.p1  ORF type:complete len:311 (+),score=2.73 gnl/Dysnectes_brevis/1167_a1301_2084:169-1101(+)
MRRAFDDLFPVIKSSLDILIYNISSMGLFETISAQFSSLSNALGKATSNKADMPKEKHVFAIFLLSSGTLEFYTRDDIIQAMKTRFHKCLKKREFIGGIKLLLTLQSVSYQMMQGQDSTAQTQTWAETIISTHSRSFFNINSLVHTHHSPYMSFLISFAELVEEQLHAYQSDAFKKLSPIPANVRLNSQMRLGKALDHSAASLSALPHSQLSEGIHARIREITGDLVTATVGAIGDYRSFGEGDDSAASGAARVVRLIGDRMSIDTSQLHIPKEQKPIVQPKAVRPPVVNPPRVQAAVEEVDSLEALLEF